MPAAPEFQVGVYGRPRTKGSLNPQGVHPNGRPRLVDSDVSRAWRRTVAAACRKERGRVGRYSDRPMIPRRVPVSVGLAFWMPGDPIDIDQGDLDKLERNVLDALSACDDGCGPLCGKHSGVYADDAQVVSLASTKYGPSERQGVVITVWAWRQT